MTQQIEIRTHDPKVMDSSPTATVSFGKALVMEMFRGVRRGVKKTMHTIKGDTALFTTILSHQCIVSFTSCTNSYRAFLND